MNSIDKFQDIMPNEVIDINYFKYIFMAIFLILIFMAFIFFIRKIRIKKEVSLTKEQIAIKNLKNLDFNSVNSKQLLYDFTIFAKECQIEKDNENNKNNNKLNKILIEIEPLKYQKNKILLDAKIKKKLKEYIDDLAF